MKKILILGILTLSALTFAADTTTTAAPANATTPTMPMMMNCPMMTMTPEMMKQMHDKGMMTMTPEMMKAMQDQGMMMMMTPEMMQKMKDQGMMMGPGMMNHGTTAPSSPVPPAKQ